LGPIIQTQLRVTATKAPRNALNQDPCVLIY